MPSRRFHTKRRHGCKQCKARRVKCDEASPCQHCKRREEPCSNAFSLADEGSLSQSLPSALDQSPTSPLDLKSLSSTTTEAALLEISGLELRLLNHYCNFVAPSISAHDHLRRMWQYEVTYQAKTHSFLMHNILSTSACHLSCMYTGSSQRQQGSLQENISTDEESNFVPSFHGGPPGHIEWQIQQSKHYERFALEQQRLAFQTYIPNLYAMTSHNQEALCASSALLSLNALASTQKRYRAPAPQPQSSSPIDDWLEISILVRGVDAVVKNAGASILDGALQPLLRHRRIEASGEDPKNVIECQIRQFVSPHVLSALDDLAPAIDRCTPIETDREMYHEALRLLRASFAIVAVNPDHESIVMVWSNLLDGQFFPFIKRREPMALVLLAYWTILFGTFRDRWWVGGLNITILRHIAEFLTSLDDVDGENKDEHEQDAGMERSHRPLNDCQNRATVPIVAKIKWRALLEWPLHENGIHGP